MYCIQFLNCRHYKTGIHLLQKNCHYLWIFLSFCNWFCTFRSSCAQTNAKSIEVNYFPYTPLFSWIVSDHIVFISAESHDLHRSICIWTQFTRPEMNTKNTQINYRIHTIPPQWKNTVQNELVRYHLHPLTFSQRDNKTRTSIVFCFSFALYELYGTASAQFILIHNYMVSKTNIGFIYQR